MSRAACRIVHSAGVTPSPKEDPDAGMHVRSHRASGIPGGWPDTAEAMSGTDGSPYCTLAGTVSAYVVMCPRCIVSSGNGSEMTGTTNDPWDVFPAASRAVQVTCVKPAGNTSPEPCVQDISPSLVRGASKVTVAMPAGVSGYVTLIRLGSVISGGTASMADPSAAVLTVTG